MNTNLCNLCGSPLRAVDGLCPSCVARTITSFIQKPAVMDEMPEVPGYEILGVIGRGGMGVVFRALRLDDELEVALKMGSAELFERLQREADTLRQLDHPHILRMLDSGLTPDGRCFIVTPLIEGGDLAKRLQQGPLPEKEALRLFRQVLSAVAYAHETGVVHRDIKPANLLLNEANNIVVADFSLAKPGEPEMALTQTTEVFGTPYYIAPEVRRGSAKVDHRADIFSLGVLLHEMLTGKLPIGQYEPSRYDRVVSRCLQENPDKRPPSIAAVEKALKPRLPFWWPWAALFVVIVASGLFIEIDSDRPPSGLMTNSLGMTFVTLPGTHIRICTHETRIRDFDAYSQAVKLPITGPETRWRHAPPGKIATPEHPVTPVSKIMADRFCEWLTKHEQMLGRISKQARYRLPTNNEWSQFAKDLPLRRPASFTEPAAMSPANALGLFDLEGNVSEWTSSLASVTNDGDFIVRGASYANDATQQKARAIVQTDGTGFRIVLEDLTPP
jgi:serine/threonine protein kinase